MVAIAGDRLEGPSACRLPDLPPARYVLQSAAVRDSGLCMGDREVAHPDQPRMTWVKIDDRAPEHPKLLKAGPLGLALWVAGLAYCNRNLTDGFIPLPKVEGLLSWSSIPGGIRAEAIAATLVSAGLWQEVEGGYQTHDYLAYQPSREEVELERKATRDRVASWRHSRRNANVTPLQSECNTTCNTNVTPAPVPVPENLGQGPLATRDGRVWASKSISDRKIPSTEPDRRVKRNGQDPDSLTVEQWFAEEFWPAYPRHVAKAAALAAMQKAFKTTKSQEAEDQLGDAILAGLELHKRTEWANRDPEKIPHAATWINQRRWTDAEAP